MHVLHGVVCRVWLYVYVHMAEEKALGDCRVWQPIWCAYKIRTKVEAKDWLKDKYQYFISVLLCMRFMILVHDDYMWSMIGYMRIMILIYDGCVLS